MAWPGLGWAGLAWAVHTVACCMAAPSPPTKAPHTIPLSLSLVPPLTPLSHSPLSSLSSQPPSGALASSLQSPALRALLPGALFSGRHITLRVFFCVASFLGVSVSGSNRRMMFGSCRAPSLMDLRRGSRADWTDRLTDRPSRQAELTGSQTGRHTLQRLAPT